MTFINVGAYVNGQRPKSKKALREALAIKPWAVNFDRTALYHLQGPLFVDAKEITDGVILSVVGPDPYAKRSWYASVSRGRDGKLRVT